MLSTWRRSLEKLFWVQGLGFRVYGFIACTAPLYSMIVWKGSQGRLCDGLSLKKPTPWDYETQTSPSQERPEEQQLVAS